MGLNNLQTGGTGGISPGGLRNLTEISAIPDSDVYLQDDWGDNKLQNRDGSGTTTYNGVEGVYRPEWTIRDNEPTVSNEQLTITGGDGIYTDINLDLSKTASWEFNGIDLSDNAGDSGDMMVLHCFAEQTSNESARRLHQSYSINVRSGSNNPIQLYEVDASGNFNLLVDGGGGWSGTIDITVTRQSDGVWEMSINGTSQGTGNDSTHTSPSVAAILGRDSANIDLNELKVS